MEQYETSRNSEFIKVFILFVLRSDFDLWIERSLDTALPLFPFRTPIQLNFNQLLVNNKINQCAHKTTLYSLILGNILQWRGKIASIICNDCVVLTWWYFVEAISRFIETKWE